MICNIKKFFLIIFIIFFAYKQKKHKGKIKTIILLKGRKYLDFCLQGVNKKIFFYFNKKPKISIIIPIYNCQKSINLTIISIQNQIIPDYEIILVNDYSKDNSKQTIENLQKNEPRIIIINNKRNMGTLYSRNIGVLSSRGKYIFPLDNDDMLFNPKLFGLLYKEAINKNYDIIGFKTIYGLDYHSNIENMFDEPFITNKANRVVNQPKLKFLSINNNDCHIWGKLIRNDVYKNAINLMGIKRYSVYLCYSEDDTMLFIVFSSAKSYNFI
jgi:glycosyltransferase involved in cell wall biosynthesis